MNEIIERHVDLNPLLDLRTSPEDDRVTILLVLPHLADFDRDPTVELVYGCKFPVGLGDLVLCPPTPMTDHWTPGVVVSLLGKHYSGRVKYVKPYERNQP